MNHIISLYTDGGGFRQKDKSYIGVSGYRILLNYQMVDEGHVVSVPGTNQFSELKAHAIGMFKIKKMIEEMKIEDDDTISVEVYSDSEYSINCITKWIYGWKKRAKDGIYYSSSKPPKPVENQPIIDVAFDILVDVRKNHIVDHYHVNSHVTQKNFDTAFERFKKVNPKKKMVSEKEFRFILANNAEVDKIVSYGYEEYLKKEYHMKNNKDENK